MKSKKGDTFSCSNYVWVCHAISSDEKADSVLGSNGLMGMDGALEYS